MWRSIGRNNSDRGPSSSFRKGMRGGRYDTVGDTPSVRHFSSEQPVLRNVHLVDHPGATRNRSGRWKEDIPFPSSEDVHPSEFRSKKLDDNACLVLPAKGKERKGEARQKSRVRQAPVALWIEGRRKGRRCSFPPPFPSPFTRWWLADEIDRVGRQKDATRLVRIARVYALQPPPLSPPFIASISLPIPPPSFERVSIRPFPLSLPSLLDFSTLLSA